MKVMLEFRFRVRLSRKGVPADRVAVRRVWDRGELGRFQAAAALWAAAISHHSERAALVGGDHSAHVVVGPAAAGLPRSVAAGVGRDDRDHAALPQGVDVAV